MIFNRKQLFDNARLLQEIHDSKKIRRSMMFVLGVLLLAISFNLFIKPCHIIHGVSGFSIITEKMFMIDPSVIILIGNVVLLIASFTFLGIEKTRKTVVGSILYPIFVKATDFLPNYISLGKTEVIVMVICGALLQGLGTGLIFKNNFTSGGTDVLKQIFSTYGKMAYSKANILSEGLIMLAGGIVFGWDAFIYSIIALSISGIVSDRVIMGISEFKTLQIVTKKDKEIKEFIIENLNRGITEMEAKGGFTGDNEKILLCAVPTREYFLATEGIKKLDPEAFVIATDTYEIQGRIKDK
ncbi:MAG: YitT family protein [Bacilli bacterium]|nr:YitT family protein [Bacilli bacterium]